jgi:hypothetical protein
MSDSREKVEDVGTPDDGNDENLKSRREFLRGLGKWSAIIIGAAAIGGIVGPTDAAGWVNGGAAWVNARGGGGAGWVNRSGGGASWINRSGGWVNRGASWVNARGGGGSWINRR